MVPPSPALIRKLPKADLHSHIDGSVPARELFAIAEKHRRKLLTPDGTELQSVGAFMQFVRGTGYGSLLDDIVRRFFPITGMMQTEETISEVGVAYVRGLKEQNVSYAEGRFAPQYHTREGLALGQVIESMAQGLAAGTEKYGARVNLIVAIGREIDGDGAREVARAASMNPAVVALDLGGREEGNPPGRFSSAFEVAASHGLKKTVHAGEGTGSTDTNLENIRAAVTELKADRIGHAIDLVKDEALVGLLLKKSVAVEMNPISNLVLGKIKSTSELGISQLLSEGVCVSVNSDDPALWPSGTINDVLVAVCNDYGLGLDALDSLIGNSFRSAFAEERERQALFEEYTRVRRTLS